MKKSSRSWLILLLATLMIASLACATLSDRDNGGGGRPEDKPTKAAKDTKAPKPTKPAKGQPTEAPAQPGDEPTQPPAAGDYDTKFPLPEDVQNFMQLDPNNDSINFQTSMSIEEVIEFYRQAFGAQGLKERAVLTVIDPGSTFSMVFDGAPNGLAVVIQGVALSPEQTNVNIRYEDV